MSVRIVTDSTADLPPELVEKSGITVAPLNVHFGEDTYKDGVDLKTDEFFEKLVVAPQLPTTSQPSVGEFLDIYRTLTANGDQVVSIHISEKLSGTMNSARQAKAALGEEGHVEVIDSLACSLALGLVALEAAEEAQAGSNLESVIARANEAIANLKLVAMLDTLEYLAKGGRVGKAQSFLGGLLQIKPLIEVKGEVLPLERVRTRRRALDRIVEIGKTQGKLKRLAVLHADAPDDAEWLAQQLRPLVDSDVVVSWIGPVIGTYTGPRAIGIGLITQD
jgi:DegV family protein with EDD domain